MKQCFDSTQLTTSPPLLKEFPSMDYNQSCWTIRNNICVFRFNLLLFFIFTYFEKNIFYAKPVIHLYLDLFNVYMIRNVNLQTCYKQYI